MTRLSEMLHRNQIVIARDILEGMKLRREKGFWTKFLCIMAGDVAVYSSIEQKDHRPDAEKSAYLSVSRVIEDRITALTDYAGTVEDCIEKRLVQSGEYQNQYDASDEAAELAFDFRTNLIEQMLSELD